MKIPLVIDFNCYEWVSSPIHLIKLIIIILKTKFVPTIINDIAIPKTLPLKASEI